MIVLFFCNKHPLIDPLSLTYLSAVIFYAHSRLSFGAASCFYLAMFNVSWVFPKAFVSRIKTFLTRPNQFICAIGIFCHATMINKVHCIIVHLLNRKNNLFIEKFVTANLQPKSRRK